MKAFTLKASDINRCPQKSLSPTHYRPDGSCLHRGKTPSVRASYRKGVEWIAQNDETACMDPTEVADFPSTLLLADLFSKEPNTVARDIVAYRKKEEA